MKTIETTLRSISINDIKIIKKYTEEKNIKKFINRDTSKKKLEKYCFPNIKKIIRKVLILKETKEIIGVISIRNISKIHKKGDIGYRIGEKYQGKGIMRNSLKKFLSNIFQKKQFNRIQARIRIDNNNSIHLAEKIGFKREGIAKSYKKIDNKYYDFYLYGLLKEDFIKTMFDKD